LSRQLAQAIAELRLRGPHAATALEDCAGALQRGRDAGPPLRNERQRAEANVRLRMYAERLEAAAEQLRRLRKEIRQAVQRCEELLCQVSNDVEDEPS
jgi:hypothetical protein